VNAYTLTFAVFLLSGAALGDRFGRRRMLATGVGIFTAASAGAALAPSVEMLIAARAIPGFGAAMVAPLTLTILNHAFPAERRGAALGLWGAVGGIAISAGPLVGGAVIEGLSWQWIFWLNVPIGLAVVPLALRRLEESNGADRSIDLGGLALASAGLVALTWAIINGNGDGWTSPGILAAFAAAAALLTGFVMWESRTPEPMLPLRLFRDRSFAAANGAALLMSFGLFGSIFLLSGALLRSRGQRGALGSRARRGRQGLGSKRGDPGDRRRPRCAILAAVFSHAGGDISGGQAYTDGLRPAVYVGALVVAVGALAAMLIPRREQPAPEPAPVPATA
jgi:MFS family permease